MRLPHRRASAASLANTNRQATLIAAACRLSSDAFIDQQTTPNLPACLPIKPQAAIHPVASIEAATDYAIDRR
jgi:hypothetical protein